MLLVYFELRNIVSEAKISHWSLMPPARTLRADSYRSTYNQAQIQVSPETYERDLISIELASTEWRGLPLTGI